MQIQKKSKNSNLKTLKFYMMDGKEEVGYAYLFLIYNQTGDYFYGLLEDIFVKKDYRQQDLGTQLVEAVIEECKGQKLDHLIATSRYSRFHIHKWYQRIGFVDYGKEFRINFN